MGGENNACNFNSHAHVERDKPRMAKNLTQEDFNSHAHVERDGLATLSVAKLVNFNSHAHVERDAGCGQAKGTNEISTHTLTWSVTSMPPSGKKNMRFQLTRSRGA